MVFHSPQLVHLPTHFGEVAPQLVQAYIFFTVLNFLFYFKRTKIANCFEIANTASLENVNLSVPIQQNGFSNRDSFENTEGGTIKLFQKKIFNFHLNLLILQVRNKYLIF